MTTQPDIRAALEFLDRLYPGGPWHLTAKKDATTTSGKKFFTKAFTAQDRVEMEQWLSQLAVDHNLYFSVNQPNRLMEKKAAREDIGHMHYLHVDLDPRPGEDLDSDRALILRLLTTELPSGLPPPSVIIDSGGGFWGIWKLEVPLRLDGSIAQAEEAKLYNLQIENLFKQKFPNTDSCHNIDRIARLPGTVNFPDELKLKKGRRVAPTLVHEFNDRVYPLTSFQKALLVQTPGETGFRSQPEISISGNVTRVLDLEEEIIKRYGLPAHVGEIINHGRVVGRVKEGDDSRSAWLFEVVCAMVRGKVPNDLIYSVITDRDFKISESILDKGNRFQAHAERQIKRAHEFVIDPLLMELNEKFAIIGNLGGKCRVVEEVFDEAIGRSRLTRQSFEDFRNRHMNRKVEVPGAKGPIFIPLGRWWLEHNDRRQYEKLVFAPGGADGKSYNLWKGFAFEAREGDCGLYLEHLKNNICAGNEAHYAYLIRWMARAVQKPDSPGQVGVVLRGEQGTGKGIAARMLGHLFGRHFMQVADPKHLVGSFNAHLRDTVFLFADESFYAGDKKHESILKMLITEDTFIIEGKGVDAEMAANCTHLMMASNNDWVIPAGRHERRFMVLDVASGKRQNSAYFKAIINQMESGGYEALLFMLLHMDLTDFDVRAMPRTQALAQQQNFSLSPEESWWFEKLQHGCMLDTGGWRREVIRKDLFDDYIAFARRLNLQRRATDTVLGIFIKRVCPGATKRQKVMQCDERDEYGHIKSSENRRVYVYEVPTLEDCKRAWEDKYGAQEWPEGPDSSEDIQPVLRKTPF